MAAQSSLPGFRARNAATIAALVFGGGCLQPWASQPFEHEEEQAVAGDPKQAKQSDTMDKVIHIGGVCSQGFASESKGKAPGASVGQWPAAVSVDAAVDQRNHMGIASFHLRQVLDAHCTGDTWCYLYAYSNGAAVLSKTLSEQDPERWNILWALVSAGNEGGSELSGGDLAKLGEDVGFNCTLARRIAPNDHRPAWNHNDTAGASFYHVMGHSEWWFTGQAPDFFFGLANDGAVAYHSSAGMNHRYNVPDDEPWGCFEPEAYYANHEVAYACGGFDRDHFYMKMLGIELSGG